VYGEERRERESERRVGERRRVGTRLCDQGQSGGMGRVRKRARVERGEEAEEEEERVGDMLH